MSIPSDKIAHCTEPVASRYPRELVRKVLLRATSESDAAELQDVVGAVRQCMRAWPTATPLDISRVEQLVACILEAAFAPAHRGALKGVVGPVAQSLWDDEDCRGLIGDWARVTGEGA